LVSILFNISGMFHNMAPFHPSFPGHVARTEAGGSKQGYS